MRRSRPVAPAGRSLQPRRVVKLARAGLIESRVEFEAGPAANNLGPRAVLRRHALRAARQRTLEANGIDCGAGPVSAVRPPRTAVRRATGAADVYCARTTSATPERSTATALSVRSSASVPAASPADRMASASVAARSVKVTVSLSVPTELHGEPRDL